MGKESSFCRGACASIGYLMLPLAVVMRLRWQIGREMSHVGMTGRGFCFQSRWASCTGTKRQHGNMALCAQRWHYEGASRQPKVRR
jgi:hypothetical protein